MQALIPPGWQDFLNQSIVWLHRNVLVPALFEQLVCVLLLVGVARWLAPALQRSCFDLTHRIVAGPLRSIAIAFSRVADWIALLLVLWFAHLAFNAAGNRADLLRLAESLVLVWVLIRLSSMLVRDERLARAIAVLAWIIAALNIAGLIAPVINLMDAMAVPVGNFRVSVLLLLKGAVTLAIFVWIANVLSRLIDQRLSVFGPLTPAVQVLAAKLVRMPIEPSASTTARVSNVIRTSLAARTCTAGVSGPNTLRRWSINRDSTLAIHTKIASVTAPFRRSSTLTGKLPTGTAMASIKLMTGAINPAIFNAAIIQARTAMARASRSSCTSIELSRISTQTSTRLSASRSRSARLPAALNARCANQRTSRRAIQSATREKAIAMDRNGFGDNPMGEVEA